MNAKKNPAIFWFVAGLLSFLWIPILFPVEQNRYDAQEPFYHLPLESRDLELRNDVYGKGHFGASRNRGRHHEGIDFLAPIGTPIRASKSGRITRATEEKGYGKYLEILHPDGLRTRYAHLSSLKVKEGDWVHRDQLIGASGKSGNASNPRIKPHLHFEIRSKESALNPKHFFDSHIVSK